MDKNPLVSIITPFLNAERFIEETIQSVFAQTYPSWELLLVDDGSNDDSTNIALKYATQYPDKVYYFEHKKHNNKGSSATRNLGIKNAKGKYLATLDADDIWLPNKLREQVSILESNPEAGMVFGDTLSWYSWTNNTLDKERDNHMHELMKPNTLKLNSVIKPPTLLVLRLSAAIVTPSMSNIMFRKNVIEDVGGFEEIFTGMHDDQAFEAKIFLSTPVYVSNACWNLYRRHEYSIYSIAKKEDRFLSAELFYLDWLKKYLSQNSYNDPDVLNALRRRMWKYKHPRLFNLSSWIIGLKRRLFKLLGVVNLRG